MWLRGTDPVPPPAGGRRPVGVPGFPARTVRLSLSLVLLVLFTGATPEPFSRSRWLAEHAERHRVEGDAGPGWQPPTAAERAAAAAASAQRPRPAAVPPGPRNVRVSQDLLAPDAGPGQAETQTEPFLAVDPENPRNLLAGYQEGRFANGGARVLTYAVSRDGGRRWNEGILPALTVATGGPWERASDPWVAFGTNGRAYYASLAFNETNPRNGMFVSTSDDGGITWNDPVAAHQNLQSLDFDDKQALTVDTLAASPWRGRVYLCWDTVTPDNRQLLRLASSDDGVNWTAPTEITGDGFNVGCLPLVGRDGVLHIVWLRVDPRTRAESLRIANSHDGGATFDEDFLIADIDGRGVQGLRTGVIPAAAVDPRTGRLYVAWADRRFTPGIDQIVIATSANGGANWAAPRRASDGPNDAPAFTPAVAVDGRGRFAVSYYTLRNDPARAFLTDVYMAEGTAPLRLKKSKRISTASFDARDAAVTQAGFFLGDYQALVGLRSGFFPFWIATSAQSRLDPSRRQSDAMALRVKP